MYTTYNDALQLTYNAYLVVRKDDDGSGDRKSHVKHKSAYKHVEWCKCAHNDWLQPVSSTLVVANETRIYGKTMTRTVIEIRKKKTYKEHLWRIPYNTVVRGLGL